MKRLVGLLLGLTLVAGPGCMLMPKNLGEARGTKADIEPAPPPPPVVLANEVSETNYARKIEAIREEMDYDETHLPGQVIIHTVDGVK